MKVYSGIILLFLFYTIIIVCGCGGERDFTGSYKYRAGPCKTGYIRLKKVQGFAGKYYVVTLIEGDNSARGREFLGVVKGNVITVKNGIIHVRNGEIEVKSGSRTCSYIKE